VSLNEQVRNLCINNQNAIRKKSRRVRLIRKETKLWAGQPRDLDSNLVRDSITARTKSSQCAVSSPVVVW
jgi:hypothetical protein